MISKREPRGSKRYVDGSTNWKPFSVQNFREMLHWDHHLPMIDFVVDKESYGPLPSQVYSGSGLSFRQPWTTSRYSFSWKTALLAGKICMRSWFPQSELFPVDSSVLNLDQFLVDSSGKVWPWFIVVTVGILAEMVVTNQMCPILTRTSSLVYLLVWLGRPQLSSPQVLADVYHDFGIWMVSLLL